MPLINSYDQLLSHAVEVTALKAQVENLEQASVQQQCRSLRLPAVADQCAPLADVAAKQRQTYLRYLEALLTAELEGANATPSLAASRMHARSSEKDRHGH